MMRSQLQKFITKIAHFFEIFLSAILILALLFFAFSFVKELTGLLTSGGSAENLFQSFLSSAMSLAVGVELIKMFSKPSPTTVIEVLLFALARQMVVGHPALLDFFIGILAVAVLFAIRKYLFTEVDSLD